MVKMYNKEVARLQAKLVRDAANVYFAEKDKHDPHVAEQRRIVAEDIRYFHTKWLASEYNG